MRLNSFQVLALPCALLLACGPGGAEQDSASPVTAQLSPAGVDCMYGIDQDGDGVTDFFDAHLDPQRAPSAAACRAAGGAVWGGLKDRLHRSGLSAAGSSAPPSYSEGGSLPQPVRTVIEGQGPQDNDYIPGVYDCDDFADDLERVLDAEGFDGTYTEICKTLPSGKKSNHAVTDVHVEGKTYWIEPQTGKQIRLDANGDGQVGTVKGHPCDGTSEGGLGVRVWNDMRERVRELGPVD